MKSWPKGLEQTCTGLAEGKAAVLFDKLARKVAEQIEKYEVKNKGKKKGKQTLSMKWHQSRQGKDLKRQLNRL